MGETRVAFELKRVDNVPALQHAWPYLYGLLLQSKETWIDYETPASIFGSLMEGSLQMWNLTDETGIVKMIVLTRFEESAHGKVMKIVWAHGQEAAHAVLSIGSMEKFAQSHGCYRLEVVMGRPGWAKLLKAEGYKEAYRVVGRTLDPQQRKDH